MKFVVVYGQLELGRQRKAKYREVTIHRIIHLFVCSIDSALSVVCVAKEQLDWLWECTLGSVVERQGS